MNNNRNSAMEYPELVAYLDGELSPGERQQVEARLASDPDYRRELAALQQSWDILDLLPSTRATEEFTRSTVEMVALSAATQIRQTGRFKQVYRLLAFVTFALIPVLAFSFGFFRTAKRLDSPNRQTAADLQIIQRLPIYRSVGAEVSPEKSIRFLELLADEQDLFVSFDEKQADAIRESDFDTTISVHDLRPGHLPKSRIEQLAINKESFERLKSQQDNLRTFNRLLDEHPRKNDLIRAMTQYHIWLRSRIFLSTQKEIDEIKDATPEEKIEKIRAMESEYFRNSFKYLRNLRYIPAIQDYRKIKAFGREILGSLRDEFIQQIATIDTSSNPQLETIINSLKSAPTDHHFFAIMMRVSSQLPGSEFKNPFFDPERIRPFVDQLSQESRKLLDQFDMEMQIRIVQIWVLTTLGQIDNSELALFEDKVLNGQQRSSLNQLDSYKKKRELLVKAFYYSLEPFDFAAGPRKLPDDLRELENWESFMDKLKQRRRGTQEQQ